MTRAGAPGPCTPSPDKGAYRDVVPGKFGEVVRLPEPLDIEITTDGFPVYGTMPPPV